MGRYIAKNIVAAGLADKALVQIAYAIGVAQPVSINVNTYGTEKVNRVKIEEAVQKVFNMTPSGIVKTFDLLNPQKNGFTYHETASYGHFGRNHFPWEKLDKVEDLKKLV